MKTLTVKIPEEMYSKLAALAVRRGESQSALVRAAIEQAVAANGVAELSVLNRIEDLVGCVDGLEDLSFNKDHFKGYGK